MISSIKKTVMVRVHLDNHQRLRRIKHELEKESLNEALTTLLDEHEENKETGIARFVKKIPSFVDNIAVVDDGSSDRMKERELGAGDPNTPTGSHAGADIPEALDRLSHIS